MKMKHPMVSVILQPNSGQVIKVTCNFIILSYRLSPELNLKYILEFLNWTVELPN